MASKILQRGLKTAPRRLQVATSASKDAPERLQSFQIRRKTNDGYMHVVHSRLAFEVSRWLQHCQRDTQNGTMRAPRQPQEPNITLRERRKRALRSNASCFKEGAGLIRDPLRLNPTSSNIP
eukprot:627647-Pyramimonas_sp.AAC.1